MPPDLALWLTPISPNLPCLEHIFMVPKSTRAIEVLLFIHVWPYAQIHLNYMYRGLSTFQSTL